MLEEFLDIVRSFDITEIGEMSPGRLMFFGGLALFALTILLGLVFLIWRPKYVPENAAVRAPGEKAARPPRGYSTGTGTGSQTIGQPVQQQAAAVPVTSPLQGGTAPDTASIPGSAPVTDPLSGAAGETTPLGYGEAGATTPLGYGEAGATTPLDYNGGHQRQTYEPAAATTPLGYGEAGATTPLDYNNNYYNQQPYNQQPYNQQPYSQQPYAAAGETTPLGYGEAGATTPLDYNNYYNQQPYGQDAPAPHGYNFYEPGATAPLYGQSGETTPLDGDKR